MPHGLLPSSASLAVGNGADAHIAALGRFVGLGLDGRPLSAVMPAAVELLHETLHADAVLLLGRERDGEGCLLLRERGDAAGLPPPRCPEIPTAGEGVLRLSNGEPARWPWPADALTTAGFAEGLCLWPEQRSDALCALVVLFRHPRPLPASAIELARGVLRIVGTVERREQAAARALEEEQRLRVTQKMEAIGQIAGGVAHDFNNLLTAIRCFSELLRDDLADDPPAVAKVDDILNATTRASTLVRQLLAFSHTQPTQLEDLEINTLLTEIRGLVRSLLVDNIRLHLEPSAFPLWFRADRGQIEQMIFNLCLNARDAMPNGGQLELRVAPLTLPAENSWQLAAGRYVQLAVADTGTGIPPEVQPRLFTPFFTTKRRGRGTGLGLSTCAVIARGLRGHVHFVSAEGQGTVFYVLLPMIDAPHLQAPDTSVACREPGNGRVLVVDDDDLVRSATAGLLRSLGYDVTTSPGSREAIEAFGQSGSEAVDLLVTDIVMPEIDGYALAQRLRTVHPKLKTLFMSGYVNDPVIRGLMDRPGAPFLPKPFSTFDLAEAISRVLRGPDVPA